MYTSLLRKNTNILAHHITTPKVPVTNPPFYMLHGVLGNKANFSKITANHLQFIYATLAAGGIIYIA